MPPFTDIVDLGKLGLKPGGAVTFDVLVPVGPFIFGEQRYELSRDPVPVTLYVTRTTGGNVIRARLADKLEGPCMRCYGDYALPLKIDHSEVHEPSLGPDTASEYVQGQELDLAQLVRDAIGLSLPTSISSPVDENGVCIECKNSAQQLAHARDTQEAQAAPEPDPRWAKLREIEF